MKQLDKLDLQDLIFIDIETARESAYLEQGTDTYEAWSYFAQRHVEERCIPLEEDYRDRAGLHAEFSKVLCISVGRVIAGKLTITTYKDADERELLAKFMADLSTVCGANRRTKLAGHSIKQFDIPFLFRRCLVHQVVPADLIDVGGCKPWDITAIDTKDLWRGTGAYPASLVAVCHALGIKSPKSDISGKDVGNVYHNEGRAGVDRIAAYCERDVLAVVNVVRHCRIEDTFEDFDSVVR